LDYVDQVLLRLLDPGQRQELFGQACLRRIAELSYDLNGVPIEGPFDGIFDTLDLGVSAPQQVAVHATWPRQGESFEIRFDARALSSQVFPRVDAFWLGKIVVRTLATEAAIESARFTVPNLLAIDAAIAAEGMPPVGAALETERRRRLLQVIRAETDNDATAHLALEAIFRGYGVDPTAAEAARLAMAAAASNATRYSGAGSVTYAPAPGAGASRHALPVACAIFVRDAGFSLADLLKESIAARAALIGDRGTRQSDVGFRLVRPIAIVWILAASTFDDSAWPAPGAGSDPESIRAARMAALSERLATQGIALAVA
jgi:hypothetical protein